MVSPGIEIPAEAIRELCIRHHVRRLALFGSVVNGGFRGDSDVYVLVEFAPGETSGFGLIDMQDELSALMGNRRVDLVTEKFLNRRIRGEVLRSAVVLHEVSNTFD